MFIIFLLFLFFLSKVLTKHVLPPGFLVNRRYKLVTKTKMILALMGLND